MRVLTACALVVLSLGAAASADTIDFNSDPLGSKPNGWTSDDSTLVHFYDTNGSAVEIYPSWWPEGNGTPGLAVFNDGDGSMLRMVFDVNMIELSLSFGNDDPYWTTAGDLAVLKIFSNGVLVGTQTVVLNRNDLMDQSIGVTYMPGFNEAYFYFGNPNTAGYAPFTYNGQYTGLTEVVDNINYRVPEPSLLALSGLGALVVAWRKRRKA